VYAFCVRESSDRFTSLRGLYSTLVYDAALLPRVTITRFMFFVNNRPAKRACVEYCVLRIIALRCICVTPTRASKRIRALVHAGRWEILAHAVERMVERDVTVDDVRHVLLMHESCRPDADRWRLTGVDLLDDPLMLMVEIEADVLVVTMFRGDE
jgi:hypothetical protein